MPFKSKAQQRVCRWCGNPVKKSFDKNGRFKGYLRTCGNEECLHKSRHEQNLGKRFEEKRICKICGNEFISHCPKKYTCQECIKTKRDNTLYRRYGISPNEYEKLIESNDGLCPICNERKAFVVDHDHKTGDIRGVICNKCNLGLHYIENEKLVEAMVNYLKKEDNV